MVKKVTHADKRKPIFLLLFFLYSFGVAFGQVHTTQNVTGSWEDPNSWAALTPEAPDYNGNLTGSSYDIYGNITRNGDISLNTGLTVKSSSTLTVTGSGSWISGNLTLESNSTMYVYGDLALNTIYVNSGAQLVVYGNLSINGTLDIQGGNVVVLGDYNAEQYSTITNSGNLLIQNNLNYSGSWFNISDPVASQVYVINGTVNGAPAGLPVQDSNVGRIADLQTNDPNLYTLYSVLASPECPNSTVTYSVAADATYNGGSSDQVGDIFSWTVTGGTITAISPSGGTIDNSGSPSTASVTISSASTTTVSITVQWNTTGLNTITVQQVSDAGCDGTTSTMNVSVGDYEKPTITVANANITSNTDAGQCSANLTIADPSYSDNCSIASVTWALSGATTASSASTGINSISNVDFNSGTTTITWTVTDGVGNTASATQTVIVTDNEAPVFGQSFANIQECALDTTNQSFTISNLITAYGSSYERAVDTGLLTDNCTAAGSITVEYKIEANDGSSDIGMVSDWLTANSLDSYEFSYDNLKASFPTATSFHVYYRITDASNNSTVTDFYITVDPVPKPGQIIPN